MTDNQNELIPLRPTAEEYRITAKVCRWTACFLAEDPSWWKRLGYPINDLREFATNFETDADSLAIKKDSK